MFVSKKTVGGAAEKHVCSPDVDEKILSNVLNDLIPQGLGQIRAPFCEYDTALYDVKISDFSNCAIVTVYHWVEPTVPTGRT